jgi:hypothetical protein
MPELVQQADPTCGIQGDHRRTARVVHDLELGGVAVRQSGLLEIEREHAAFENIANPVGHELAARTT